MRLIEAFKAFWKVLTGTDLVPKAMLEELKQSTDKAETMPDRFAEGAVYTLVLMQREGRLVDFLQENIDNYTDEQIGAAVRSIHSGAGKVLAENFHLKPVRSEDEGAKVEVPESFDSSAIKLTGSVPDQGPYKGTLAHRGWRADDTHFPARNQSVDPNVIQPAEIQI